VSQFQILVNLTIAMTSNVLQYRHFDLGQTVNFAVDREFEQAVAAAAMTIGSSRVSSSDAEGTQP
jgi:hypothetical protein